MNRKLHHFTTFGIQQHFAAKIPGGFSKVEPLSFKHVWNIDSGPWNEHRENMLLASKENFIFAPSIFRGELLVSGRVFNNGLMYHTLQRIISYFSKSHSIHVWYVYLPTFTIFFTYIYHILPLKTTIHVGKYASPMDGMGMIKWTLSSKDFKSALEEEMLVQS